MFKEPRKVLCSDVRFTMDALHDRIYHRLPEPQQHEYLLKVADFFHDIDADERNKGRTMQMFASVVHEYLTDAESSKLLVNMIHDENERDVCECGSYQFVLDKGYRTCDRCGITIPWQDTTRGGLTYDDPREEVHMYPYRRANHFQEWLIQCQAKQSTTLPDSVFESISGELRKRRMDVHELNSVSMKSIMKALRLNKYYEHIAYIMYKMTGKQPLRLSVEIEERMKKMFNEIQEPFDKVVQVIAPKRKNFLSYSFVLRKFAELMELDEIIDSFPLLKSRDKLHVQDAIWKAMCEELSWRFIPSL